MKKRLKVAVHDFAPMIMETEGKFKGFEIELWEKIAKENDWECEYERKSFQEIIPEVAQKKADVGLASLTINEKREKLIDFSHPTFDSGLLILVNKKNNKINIWESFKTFFREGKKLIAESLALVLGFVVIFGNLLWLAELGAKTFSNSYFPGIFESYWLVICSMSTDSFGDYVPHTWWGRVIIVGIIVGGVAIFGLLIAQVTAFMAVKKIKGQIDNYHDLKGKRVATVDEAACVDILGKIGVIIVPVKRIEEAYQKLARGQVEAVVFDAPVLTYMAENSKLFETVGELFDKQKYGIALQPGSPLRETVNRTLLKLRETGVDEQLYKKWFGENELMED